MRSLEKLICAGMTALALACGDGNGSSSSSGSTVPGCTSHNDCRGERMCVEGECKDYEQGCPVDYTFRCDEGSKFDGIYRVEDNKSTCALAFDNEVFSEMSFCMDNTCTSFHPKGRSTMGNACLFNNRDANVNMNGNYITVAGDLMINDSYAPLEFTKCSSNEILFRWSNRSCQALLKKDRDYEKNNTDPN